MILVFTTTFIIITSTSVAHGPFAAHAASTKQQQNKHKSTVTVFDSIDNVNNVPEGSTQSGITRPVVIESHGHRHQRQQHGGTRHSKDKTIGNLVKQQLNIVSSPVISPETPNYQEELNHIQDEEDALDFENTMKDHIALSPKWRNPEKQSTSATFIISPSTKDEQTNRLNIFPEQEVKSSVSSEELNEDETQTICSTPSSAPMPTQHCAIKPKNSEAFTRRICAKGDAICIPSNYSKFDLPNELERTEVHVGIDIKDIPKIDDKEFSITLNAFFVVRWTDRRMSIDQEKLQTLFKKGESTDGWIPVDVSFIKEFWLPDAEILNLKEFKTLDVLSKLEGLWLNKKYEIMYAVATRITFICPMTFTSFPLDVQICKFQVGSFNYAIDKMIFRDEFISESDQIRSVLDYYINITALAKRDQYYVALTGNYSVAGFELTLRRKVSHYIITYYLPSGMFVIVSWISFLVPADIVPGRMTLLVTVFLVLVNIFNTITTNIPKAEGLTAIEAWVIVCVLFVFGALIEYAGVLLKIKLGATRKQASYGSVSGSRSVSRENSVVVNNGNTMAEELTKQEKRVHQIRCATRKRQKEDQSHAKLDILFLMLFPLFFLVFNVIYWTTFLYAPCRNDESSCDDGMHSNTIGVGGAINDNPTTSTFSPVDDIQTSTNQI